MASAGLYANLHLAQADNHTSTPPLTFYRPPNHQCQSTEGKMVAFTEYHICLVSFPRLFTLCVNHHDFFTLLYFMPTLSYSVCKCNIGRDLARILVQSLVWKLRSVLRRCWLGGRKGIRPVKNWVVGCWHGCLGWGADLHIAQQMPLPLTTSCSIKSRFVLISWFYLSGTCSLGWSRTYSRRTVKRLCVLCVLVWKKLVKKISWYI